MYKACFHWFIDEYELVEGGLDILANKKGAEKKLNTLFLEAYNRGVEALNGYYGE